MLGGHQLNARAQKRLLGVEHVEGRPLADLGLFAHAGQRNFVGRDRRAGRPHHPDLGFNAAPSGDDGLADLIA